MLQEFLSFRGVWRKYQQRVLDRSELYLADGKIHIVAAPGAGKTVLGIELLRRLDQPALILAPTITIREQWVQRMKEIFLQDTADAEAFAAAMSKSIGKYKVVYTRNAEGRRILLKGRLIAFANQQQRCLSLQRVKGVLE